MKKKNEDMETTIQTLKGDNVELMKENASLKRQIGGYKSSNERFKKQAKNDALCIKSLQDEIVKLKAYAKEADELNEQKAQKITGLNSTINEKDLVIVGLQEQNQTLIKDGKENKRLLENAAKERDKYKDECERFRSMPWYKRLFYKG